MPFCWFCYEGAHLAIITVWIEIWNVLGPRTSHQRWLIVNNRIIVTRGRCFRFPVFVSLFRKHQTYLKNKWTWIICENCYQSVIVRKLFICMSFLVTFDFGFPNCHSQSRTQTFRQFLYGSGLVFCHLSNEIWRQIWLFYMTPKKPCLISSLVIKRSTL